MLKRKRWLFTAGLFIVGILVGVGTTLSIQYFKGPKQIVNVTGQGVVEASADQASINIEIQSSSWSQDQAVKDNKQEVQDLKDKLIGLGIPESRISQSSYSTPPLPMTVQPDQINSPLPMMAPGQTIPPTEDMNRNTVPVIIPPVSTKNPTVSTALSITLDSIAGIDKIFAVINSSPDAKITSTNYSLKNSSIYETQAREKALQDARNQVESIARINNLHVGKLLFINNNSGPIPMYKEGSVSTSAQPSLNSGVTYGEKTIEITASFNAQYELD